MQEQRESTMTRQEHDTMNNKATAPDGAPYLIEHSTEQRWHSSGTLMREAKSRKRKINPHLPYRMVINGNKYYFLKPLPDNKHKAIPLGRVMEDERQPSESLKIALDKYKELYDETAGDESFAWLISQWQKDGMEGYEEKTKKTYGSYCRVISAQMGKLRITQVRPVHIARFIDYNFGKMPFTANKYKAVFSNIFVYAIRRGLRETNPTRDIKDLPEVKRKRYITDEELMRLLKASPPMLQVLIRIAATTGQRIGDLLTLKWESVTDETIYLPQSDDYNEELDEELDELELVDADSLEELKDGVSKGKRSRRQQKIAGVLFYPSKTRKTSGMRVPIALNEQLRETLQLARSLKTAPSEYVVRKRNGTPYQYEGARSAYIRAVDRARRDYLIECAEKRLRPNLDYFTNMHFHDLKRKALTDADSQGKDAQRLGGHNSPAMTKQYIENTKDAPQKFIDPPKMPF